MVSTELKTGMILSGRGMRACDMCGKERARWYCLSDEAYLCELCDGSVHSANAVAIRHERVKIRPDGKPSKLTHTLNHSKTKTIKLSSLQCNTDFQLPSSNQIHKSWCGSRKRSLVTRNMSSIPHNFSVIGVQMSHGTASIKDEKDENILLYGLSTVDDLFSDLPTPTAVSVKLKPFSPSLTFSSGELNTLKSVDSGCDHEVPIYEPLLQEFLVESQENLMGNILPSFAPLSIDNGTSKACKSETNSFQTPGHTMNASLLEVVSSASKIVTSRLNEGNIAENRSIEDSDIDTFDVMDLCANEDMDDNMINNEVDDEFVDMDVWKGAYGAVQHGSSKSIFRGNPFKGRGEREFKMDVVNDEDGVHHQYETQPVLANKLVSLRLDYEEVLHAWSDRGSLWMDGQRPQTVPDILIFDNCVQGLLGHEVPNADLRFGGRAARVVRYKQKRHTRHFSKTIRYEVRKLNAEKRPRLKGRFIKRGALESTFAIK